MKILYCANARIPTQKAHGFQISKMCEQLGLTGGTVELWHPTRKNDITLDVFEYYNLQKTFRVCEIPMVDCIAFAKIIGPVAMWLQRLIFYFLIKKKLKKETAAIFTRDPEVVYAAKKAGCFVVYENHDGLSTYARLQLFLIAGADRIITTNEYIKQQLIDHSICEAKITVIPHGVDFAAFASDKTKAEAGKALVLFEKNKEFFSHKKVLVYTGNFTTMNQDKGIADILHALQRLPQEVVFVAIGGSEKDIQDYTEQATQLGVLHRVLFIGRQSQQQLGLWQKVADILLMPFPDRAHYREHMAPLKMFEYMVSKRPIIASDLPSIRAVLDETTAYFCNPGDPESLAHVITTVMATNTAKNVQTAYATAQNYRWDIRAQKIRSLIPA